MHSAIILLSGGLDSLVALDIIHKKYKEIKALFFNYRQKAYAEEFEAVKKISEKYGVELEQIDLKFLSKLSNNALVDESKTDFSKLENVWIPNRNGLFINIAGCFCDSECHDAIVIGVNKEESGEFKDNRPEFIKSVQNCLKFSTINHPKVIAPVSHMNKLDLVNYMIENNISFDLIKSCYQNIETSNKKHCGTCMSCKFLYNAIEKSKKPELLKEIF